MDKKVLLKYRNYTISRFDQHNIILTIPDQKKDRQTGQLKPYDKLLGYYATMKQVLLAIMDMETEKASNIEEIKEIINNFKLEVSQIAT